MKHEILPHFYFPPIFRGVREIFFIEEGILLLDYARYNEYIVIVLPAHHGRTWFNSLPSLLPGQKLCNNITGTD